MMEDVAALNAEVDKLLSRQQHLLEDSSHGLGPQASPAIPAPDHCSTEFPVPGSWPPRLYDPLRYCGPGSPQRATNDGGAPVPDEHREAFSAPQPFMSSLEAKSLLVQARLREQAQLVFERRCDLERWRSGSCERGPEDPRGGSAAAREGGAGLETGEAAGST